MHSRKFYRTILYFLPFLLLLGACHNANNKEKNTNQPVKPLALQPGVVSDTIPCATDKSESYALYLPSNYKPERKFPVIFFFDAHARGPLVVKRYKDVAERLGFILAVSNNSENGQSAKIRGEILYHFMQDVEQRFSVDPDRIYTAGFSGGARVAAGIGLFNKSVAGTIGLEAGFPPIHQMPDTHLTWVGVVGNVDFNYLEMKTLESRLNELGMRNLLIVYSGKHALPPPDVFKKAYEFLMLDAMRKKFIPRDQALIDTVRSAYDVIRSKAQKEKNCLAQLQADRSLVQSLGGLTNVSFYQKEIKFLSASKSCRLRQKEMKALFETEGFFQQKISESINMKDAAWWKRQILELYRKKNVARDEQVKLMDQRLLNYLSLMSYLYANSSLKNGQLDDLKKFLMIYQMVDPNNSEVYFMKAEYNVLTHQNAKALQALQDAINHGYKDADRLKNNAYFQALKASPKFTRMLRGIETDSHNP